MSHSEPHRPQQNQAELAEFSQRPQLVTVKPSTSRLDLEVTVADDATAIEVSDHLFRTVYKGSGSKVISLPPGIYGIKASAGYATEEKLDHPGSNR